MTPDPFRRTRSAPDHDPRPAVPVGAGGILVSAGPDTVRVNDTRRERYGRIDGAPVGNAYPWVEVDDTYGTFPDYTHEGFRISGTTDSFPLRELNGRTDVPVGTKVKVWLSSAGDSWIFEYQPQLSGSGTSPGISTVIDVRCIDGINRITRTTVSVQGGDLTTTPPKSKSEGCCACDGGSGSGDFSSGGSGGSGSGGGDMPPVFVDCCSPPIPQTLYATLTSAGCAAIDGTTIVLVWNGSQWVGSGNLTGTCGSCTTANITLTCAEPDWTIGLGFGPLCGSGFPSIGTLRAQCDPVEVSVTFTWSGVGNGPGAPAGVCCTGFNIKVTITE